MAGLGWSLHRLWSSAWYTYPDSELKVLTDELKSKLEAQRTKAVPAQGQPKSSKPGRPKLKPDTPETPGAGSASEPADEQDQSPEEVKIVAVGDLVKITYLDPPKRTKKMYITDQENQQNNDMCYKNSPLGKVLLNREEGEEVLLLVKNVYKSILIESITKGAPLKN
jgi:hypothetical protein